LFLHFLSPAIMGMTSFLAANHMIIDRLTKWENTHAYLLHIDLKSNCDRFNIFIISARDNQIFMTHRTTKMLATNFIA
jgi:hypothetical protein